MQERVSNEAQSQSARQEYLQDKLKTLPDETMRNNADRAWRLRRVVAGSLPETLNEARVKLQVIKGLPAKLQTATHLTQSLKFDSMINTIEQVIIAIDHDQPPGAHRLFPGREALLIIDEDSAEDFAEIRDKQRPRASTSKESKICTQ